MAHDIFVRLNRANIFFTVVVIALISRDCVDRETVRAPVDPCASVPVTIRVDDIARAAECAAACEYAASRTTFLPKVVAIRECEDACGVVP